MVEIRLASFNRAGLENLDRLLSENVAPIC